MPCPLRLDQKFAKFDDELEAATKPVISDDRARILSPRLVLKQDSPGHHTRSDCDHALRASWTFSVADPSLINGDFISFAHPRVGTGRTHGNLEQRKAQDTGAKARLVSCLGLPSARTLTPLALLRLLDSLG